MSHLGYQSESCVIQCFIEFLLIPFQMPRLTKESSLGTFSNLYCTGPVSDNPCTAEWTSLADSSHLDRYSHAHRISLCRCDLQSLERIWIEHEGDLWTRELGKRTPGVERHIFCSLVDRTDGRFYQQIKSYESVWFTRAYIDTRTG